MLVILTIAAVLVVLMLIKLETKIQGRLINGHFWKWSDHGYVCCNEDGLKHTLKYEGKRLRVCGTYLTYDSIETYVMETGNTCLGYIHKFNKEQQQECIAAMQIRR